MKKLIKCVWFLLLFVLLGSFHVMAEDMDFTDEIDYIPARVKTLKVKDVKETSCTLYWSKVPDVSGYYIYQIKANGAVKTVGRTAGKTYTVKKLKPGKEYVFQVSAYRNVDGVEYESTKPSKTVSVIPELEPPAVPANFMVTSGGKKALKLSWTGSAGAAGYVVASYDEDDGYTELKTTTNTTVTFNGLKASKKYSYAVCSYREVNGILAYSKYSAVKTGQPGTIATEIKNVRTFYFKGKTTRNVWVEDMTTGKKYQLPKGTPLTSKLKVGSYLKANLETGEIVQVKSSAVKLSGIDFDSSEDYTREVKEGFVNSKGNYLASPTEYLVWISHYRARVNIFKGSAGKWKLVRTCLVAIGRAGSVRGLRAINGRERSSFYDALPAIMWSPHGNAFHAMMGATPGTAVSSGCIRCQTPDLWYLYDNIPDGTTVYSW